MWIGAYSAPGTTNTPEIVTTALPGGTVGTAYSAQLLVINNNGPVAWSATGLPAGLSLSPAGLISGNPTAGGTFNPTFTVLDSLNQSDVDVIQIMVTSVSQPTGPQQLLIGVVDSTHAVLSAWPTQNGGETGYFFYRSTDNVNFAKLNTNPITPSITIAGGSVAQAYIVDGYTPFAALAPNTKYFYKATAVVAGAETQFSATVSLTTLAGPVGTTGATVPTAPLAPESWMVLPPATGSLQSVPVGNNLFIISPTGGTPASTANPGGGLTWNGCSLAFAFGKTNLAGGDVYAFPPSTFNLAATTLPVFTGTATNNGGFTHFVVTTAPEYAGPTGTLPSYTVVQNTTPLLFNLTVAPTVAAQFVAQIAGNVMTVVEVLSGTIPSSGPLVGPQVPIGQTITSQTSGTAGGIGVYALGLSQTAFGGNLTGGISGFTVTFTVAAQLQRGNFIAGTGVTAGSWITGTGGNPTGSSTTWGVTPSQTVGSGTTLSIGRQLSAGGATTATLTAPFTGRTGYYAIKFQNSGAAFGLNQFLNESRVALFKNGSATITWNIPLFVSATTQLRAMIGNFVTPWDCNAAGLPSANASPSMATLLFPNNNAAFCFTQNAGTTKVRYTGLAFQVVPNTNPTGIATVEGAIFDNGLCDSRYMDRCVIGNDTSLYLQSMPYVLHGVSANSNHALYHQCYFYGIIDGSNGNGLPGGDANCIGIAGGAAICAQNCYLEGQAEHIITGGQPIAQNNVPSDIVRRWNWSHKPTNWQFNGIGTGPKNHFEHKVCLRGADTGNWFWNNWAGAASQGQQGRGSPFGARDQTSGWAPANGAVPAPVITAVNTGTNTITFTASPLTFNPFFFRGLNIGYAYISGAAGITNMVFPIASVGGGSGPNFTITSAVPFIGTYTSGGTVTPCQTSCQGPWCVINDVAVSNCVYEDVGSGFFNFGAIGDPSVVSTDARISFKNNIVFGNPGTDTNGTQVPAQMVQLFGDTVDTIIAKNTILLNQSNPNYQSPSFSAGIAQVGPTTPNFAQLTDRVQMSDNILDGVFALEAVAQSQQGGVPGLNASFSNSSVLNNAAVTDTAGFAATPANGNIAQNHHAAVGYQNMGFAVWNGVGTASPTSFPANPSNWNVVSGALATASTTNGPIGAIFQTTALSSDAFPRIASSPIGGTFQASYASSTWQAWAAKHNIIIFSWYIGIEQAMGTTLAAIHANIKSVAQGKGVICRPIMYFMQQQIATAANNGGNSQTEVALINKINSVNWWIRGGTGYPGGTIVTGDTSASGVVNVARGGPVDSATGFNVNQWFPYYGYNVLVLGNAVSLFGEANNIAANPNTVGISMDNQYWSPRQNGSWTWGTTVTGFAGTASGAALTQQGNADMVAAWRAIWPGLIVVGNVNYGINTVQNGGGAAGNLTGQAALYDVALFELVIGPNSSEQFVGFGSATSGTMLELINQEATANATGTVIFHQAGRPGGVAWTAPPSGTPVGWQTTTWVAADWQALRYGESWAMLRNWHYQMMMDAGSDQNNAQDMLWSDTFDRGGKQTVGWLGSPTDGPQSAAQFPNGVWGRHFQNGLVLVNPVGNGTQTVTLPAGVYFTLPYNGYSDSTVNTDTQVNSVTLLAGDGRTLAKVA